MAMPDAEGDFGRQRSIIETFDVRETLAHEDDEKFIYVDGKLAEVNAACDLSATEL